MQLIQNKKLLTLSSILAFLVLLFGASFIKPIQKKSQQLKSAILNPKYEVSKITINFPITARIELTNCGDFWGGFYQCGISTNSSQYSFFFPVNTNMVESFLKLSKTVSDYNLVLEGKSKKDLKNLDETYEKYGLDDHHATVLTFYDTENKPISKLYFGNFNQTMDQIFFKSDKKYSIYSMNSKIADYLEEDAKFWCDQDMIPKSISKNIDSSKIQNIFYGEDEYPDELGRKKLSPNLKASKKAYSKIVSLRYGNLGPVYSNFINPPDNYENLLEPSQVNLILTVKVIDDKSTEYEYYFYRYNMKHFKDPEAPDQYCYEMKISPSMLYSDEAKKFIKKLNCKYYISEWTFNSLTQSLKQE